MNTFCCQWIPVLVAWLCIDRIFWTNSATADMKMWNLGQQTARKIRMKDLASVACLEIPFLVVDVYGGLLLGGGFERFSMFKAIWGFFVFLFWLVLWSFKSVEHINYIVSASIPCCCVEECCSDLMYKLDCPDLRWRLAIRPSQSEESSSTSRFTEVYAGSTSQ